jgi:hypothetical protein
MRYSTHEQGAVELYCAWRKALGIAEKARASVLYNHVAEWSSQDKPQLHTVETTRFSRR